MDAAPKSNPLRLRHSLAVVLCLVAAVLAWPVYKFAFYREVARHVSEDGAYAVSIAVRPHFPPNEFIDPAVDVRVVLLKEPGSRRVRHTKLFLIEESDAHSSDVRWHQNEVEVVFEGEEFVRFPLAH